MLENGLEAEVRLEDRNRKPSLLGSGTNKKRDCTESGLGTGWPFRKHRLACSLPQQLYENAHFKHHLEFYSALHGR